MKRRGTAATRIALALTMWSATTLLTLRVLGIFNDGHLALLETRTRLCEAVAIGCSEFASRDDWDGARMLLAALVDRDDQVVSAGLRADGGELLGAYGPHEQIWSEQSAEDTSNNCIYVPVVQGAESLGRIEVSFEPLARKGLAGFFQLPTVQVMLLATAINFATFAVFLRYCLRTLNPNQVVPGRVRSALDTIAESLVVLDNQGQIALVNQAFADVAGLKTGELVGQRIDLFQWSVAEAERGCRLPWEGAGQADGASKIWLQHQGRKWTFIANVATIQDDTGTQQGRLVSLNDVTELEEKQAALQSAMQALQASQREIEEQNEQLQFLATRDPLTSCLNRRSFFEAFEQQWRQVRRYNVPLSCVMVDVDHFKSINDNHGHATGDEVLRTVAAALLDAARDTDLVCRYGGEEFCILLPHIDLEGGRLAAERDRQRIESLEFELDLKITASLGVSDCSFAAEEPEQLVEQADQCLYVAKRNGRNQVVTYDQALAAASSAASSAEKPSAEESAPKRVTPTARPSGPSNAPPADAEAMQLTELASLVQSVAGEAGAATADRQAVLRQALLTWLHER